MAVKKIKPTTPGRRGMTVADFSGLSKVRPYKRLTVKKNSNAGRNVFGRVTVRHRGAGVKKLYRIVSFGQEKMGIEGTVKTIEYDPNRSGRIALVSYSDGDYKYILAPDGLKVGDKIICTQKASLKPGNRVLLANVTPGTFVYNIELQIGKGGQIVRSAGTLAQVTGGEGNYVYVKLPSGEVRKILKNCFATIGQVSNPENNLIKIGKAGRNRWKGKRPSVRGKAMAPVSHPHGGGEAQNDIGMAYQKTPWGKHAMGKKTRTRKVSDKYIIKSRKKK